MHMLGIDVQTVEDLMRRQIQFIEKQVDRFLNLLRRGLFVLPPTQDVMTDGVSAIVKQFLDSLENCRQRIKEILKISNNFPQLSLKNSPVIFDKI